eukprot:6231491-Pyramimonas_sp.AAC.1
MSRALLTDSGHHLLPVDNMTAQAAATAEEMMDLIEMRIGKLYATFSRTKRPRMQLMATSSEYHPEAQNQSELQRLATTSAAPPRTPSYADNTSSKQVYGAFHNHDAK